MSEARSKSNYMLSGIILLIMLSVNNHLFFNNWTATIGVFIFGIITTMFFKLIIGEKRNERRRMER